jgi:hypothetical protein
MLAAWIQKPTHPSDTPLKKTFSIGVLASTSNGDFAAWASRANVSSTPQQLGMEPFHGKNRNQDENRHDDKLCDQE